MTAGKTNPYSRSKFYLNSIVIVMLGVSISAGAQLSNSVSGQALVFSADKGRSLPDAPSALASGARQSNSPAESEMPATGVASHVFARWKALSASEKFDLFVQNSYSPSALMFTAASAQTLHAVPFFQERPRDFGHRYAAAYADAQSSAFIENFLVPALMRQDPRYFRGSTGTIHGRVGYAMSRVFITRSDDGGNTFNTSGIAGAFLSAAVHNAYHPYYDRSLDGTVSRALSRLASRAGMNVVREFWPDLRQKSKGRLARMMAAYNP